MPDFLNHHRREAARLRSLAGAATTEAIKARLSEEAEKHERVAQIAEALELVDQPVVKRPPPPLRQAPRSPSFCAARIAASRLLYGVDVITMLLRPWARCR